MHLGELRARLRQLVHHIVERFDHGFGCGLEDIAAVLCKFPSQTDVGSNREPFPQDIGTGLHYAAGSVSHADVKGLCRGDQAVYHGRFIGRGCIFIVFRRILLEPILELRLEAHAHLIPVVVQRVSLPLAVLVAVRRPVDGGQNVQRALGWIQRYLELAAGDRGHAARHIQAGGAVVLLAGKEQGRRVGPLVFVGGEVLFQDAGREFHGDHRQVVLVDVRLRGHHDLAAGDAPTRLLGRCAVAGVVEARLEPGDGQVTLALAVLAPAGEARIQAPRHLPQTVVGLAIIVFAGILVGDGHGHPVILADAEAGQPPFLAVGMHYLRLVVVVQQLHQPHHAHLVGVAPLAGVVGPVEHAGRESNVGAARLILDHVQGQVGSQSGLGRALVADVAHRDAVGLQLLQVNHLVAVRPVGQVAQVGAGRKAALFQHDGVRAVHHRQELVAAERLRGAAGDVLPLPSRHLVAYLTAQALVQPGRVHGSGVLKSKAEFGTCALGRQGHRGADPAGAVLISSLKLHTARRRGGEWQGDGSAAHLDLQHRHQTHVAVPTGVIAGGLRIHKLGKGGVRGALDLAFLVAAGPVQHVAGVGEVLLLGGVQLEVHEDGVAVAPGSCRRVLLQAVHDELKGIIPGKGRAAFGGGRVRFAG